ncbi:unnamed protein product [Cyprideis torosa]|uniref:Multivesicular body subunit 12A n=1 Tax=Cyprideis torosa TaxID=163714 RepID=A0A7R8ZNX9_9CRUS|nr:unnamed protein product [Cyprideis torosa]CAG0888662.1 unnamed protein product [Cyprideis torosa]
MSSKLTKELKSQPQHLPGKIVCPSIIFLQVSQTFDTRQDADLWRDSYVAFRRNTRYLCYSRQPNPSGLVVEHLRLFNEEETFPAGYSPIPVTKDSGRQAIRKRKLAYRMIPGPVATQTILDIIVMGRAKSAPEGFTSIGEVDGLLLCVKPGPPPTPTSSASNPSLSSLPYGLHQSGGSQPSMYPSLSSAPYPSSGPPSVMSPSRPAPPPPPVGAAYPKQPAGNTGTLGVMTGLEGIPFRLSPALSNMGMSRADLLPPFKRWTMDEVQKEFAYDFKIESQALA